MRHGMPTFTGKAKVTSNEMAEWIAQYNLSDTGSDTPPASSQLLASSASHILSSPLPRALSSLRRLGCEPDSINEVFREADLPVIQIPGLRLSPSKWAALLRVMWLLGLSANVERLRMAKQRAIQATDILVTLAKQSNGPVLLMGHGVMNRLIARELVSQGWKVQRRPGRDYWSAGVYTYP